MDEQTVYCEVVTMAGKSVVLLVVSMVMIKVVRMAEKLVVLSDIDLAVCLVV